jgi:MFS family permease
LEIGRYIFVLPLRASAPHPPLAAPKPFLGIDRGGWLIFAAMGFSGLGTGPFIAFTAIYQHDLGATAVQIGLVAAVGMLISTLLMLPGTRLAEHGDLRKTIVAGWMVGIPAPLFFAVAPSWWLTAAGLAFTSASVINTPAINVYLTLGIARERVALVMTTVLSSYSLGLIASSLVSGWLAEAISIRALFWFSFGFFCLAALTIWFLPAKTNFRDATTAVGYRKLLRFPAFMVLLCLFSLVTAVIFLPWTFTALYAQEVGHASNLAVGGLMAILYLGSILMGLTLGGLRRRLGGVAVVLCFEAVYVVSALVLLAFGGFAMLALAFFLRGAFWSFRQVMTAVIGEVLPNQALAKGYGLFALVTGAAAGLAYLIGGWMYGRDPAMPFWSSMVLMAFALLGTVMLRAYFKANYLQGGQAPPQVQEPLAEAA